ncbi:MAG: BrnA antitoxin family protein [Candidatus Competibacter sp.]
MTGKSGNTGSYSAEQLEAMRERGEDKTDLGMSHAEAMRRRHADADAPKPYAGWENTITVGLPEPKEQITLRLDRDVLRWFRTKGKGYQTLINAVLRGYYEHENPHKNP